MPPVRFGLLDSGVVPSLASQVVSARRFEPGVGGVVVPLSVEADRLGHGSVVAGIILTHCPAAEVVNAQVFRATASATATVVAGAVDWAVTQGVRVINLSLGVREDCAPLRAACSAARRAGIIVVAAAPARGMPVFPAAYDDVIGVCGDARCQSGDASWLGGAPADFGACPRPTGDVTAEGVAIGGASCASAHVTGLLLTGLEAGMFFDADTATEYLRRMARFSGRERKQ